MQTNLTSVASPEAIKQESVQERLSIPRLREASFEDYPMVAALARRYSLGFEPVAAWKHLWTENPAYRALQGKWPIGWVLETESNDIVGYLGNIPLFYQLGGDRLLAATGRCWVVDEHYRSYSVLLMNEHFSQNYVDLFINATLKRSAVEAYSSFGTRKVPAGSWDRAIFWVTGPLGFAHGLLLSHNIPFNRVLSLSLGMALFCANKSKAAFKMQGGLHLEVLDGFDDQFNVFWEELKQRYPGRLLAERTQEVLQWHFKYAVAEKRTWIVTAKERGRILAYAVFSRFDNARIGMKRMRLVDFQEVVTGALPSMMCWALEHCKGAGIHVLENIGVQVWGTTNLADHAPFTRQLPNWMFQYKATQKSLSESLSDPSVWNPSFFDGDASLY